MDISAQLAPASESCRDLRFSQTFAAAAIGIAICHFDGRILEANAAMGRILEYPPDELVGIDPWQLHDDEIQDGNSFKNSLLLCELIHGERDSFVTEKLYRRKSGSELWGRLTVSLARNSRHDPAFLVALLEDATERKQMEESLRQAEKMEAIGRLAGGIAHDFNNLLTGILLYCDLLLSKLEPDHRLRSHVEEVRAACEQGASLTKQLLGVARKQEPEPCAIELNEIVSSTEGLLRRLIGEQIELVTALDPAAGTVFADVGQLRQVLLNLVLNARDATLWNGKIRISTQASQLPHNMDDSGTRPGVSLTVEDNGCGMSPDTRARLFEPFFTTKQLGRGTGMGLATVQRIVCDCGGSIQVVSELGHGARIEVLLPSVGSAQIRRGTKVLGLPILEMKDVKGNSL